MSDAPATDPHLDLSRLEPAPIASTAYDGILQARLTSLKGRFEAAGIPWNVDRVKFNPGVIVQQEDAYREMLVRQEINDAAASLRLATAVGPALDHLGQTYHRTARREIAPGVLENDASYRAHAQASAEARPLYGLVPGGYAWRVAQRFAADVKDVVSLRAGPGLIDLMLLGHAHDGTVPAGTVARVQAAFDGEAHHQSTDTVTVKGAEIRAFAVDLLIRHRPGLLAGALVEAATRGLTALRDARHAIGRALTRSAIETAATSADVEEVILVNAGDLPHQASFAAPWLTVGSISTQVAP